MRIASLKSLALWIIIGIIIVALIASFYAFTAQANVYHLYASACLGGWENTHLATGLPQASKNGEAPVLAGDNSARLNAGTLARIYCGGFTGDILADTIPTKILARFSWAIEYPRLQIEEPPTPQAVPPINEDLMQEVNALLEEMVSETSISSPPQEYPTTQDVYESAVQEPKPQIEDPAPAPNPFEAIPRNEEQVQVTEETETQNESLQNELTPETPTTISAEEVSTIISTDAPANEIPYGLLEVTYTLDGVEWKRLGFVRANEFHNKYFEIPIEEASDWKDISKIQISVQGVPTLDSLAPTIYLDAIWLEVEYEKPMEKAEYQKPTEEVEYQKPISVPQSFITDKNSYTVSDVIKISNVPLGSAIKIYWLDNPETALNPDPDSRPSNVYAALVSDDGTVNIEASTLVPGSYVFVNTFEPGHCGGFYLSQCRARSDYLGEIPLLIKP